MLLDIRTSKLLDIFEILVFIIAVSWFFSDVLPEKPISETESTSKNFREVGRSERDAYSVYTPREGKRNFLIPSVWYGTHVRTSHLHQASVVGTGFTWDGFLDDGAAVCLVRRYRKHKGLMPVNRTGRECERMLGC